MIPFSQTLRGANRDGMSVMDVLGAELQARFRAFFSGIQRKHHAHPVAITGKGGVGKRTIPSLMVACPMNRIA